jgi:tetratricopeptide (TPR) repeat protein
MRRLTLLCFLLFSLLLFSTRSLAGEQYTSRLYIDIEQDATENVALSVSELEKQIETLQDDFARASAEKFLAQHYAASKDYPKAIAHLEDALKRPGMADNSRRDMLADLARLYLLQKDYDNAAIAIKRYLDSNPPENADMYLLLAQIHYKNKKYVDSAAALDKVLFNKNAPLQKNPPKELLQSALSIYYSIGNYERSTLVIQLLVEQDINNAELWQQWISLELKAGKKPEALTVMSLAWEKGIPFRDQDVLLLCDLYAINKIPGRGARTLEEAIKNGRVANNSKISDRLFRLWLQAGERDKAQQALVRAAQLGDDKELQLHLAQLYMEKEQWQPMQDMVLKACNSALPDALVGRANLYLGISQFKLGDVELARRSFINATQIGGENDKAGQWLSYIKAAPATEREKIGIAGPCYSASTQSIWTAGLPDNDQQDEDEQPVENISTLANKPDTAASNIVVSNSANYTDLLAQKKGNPTAVVNSKVTASQKLYLAEVNLTPQEFADKILSTAIKLGITISKNGGSINGPMHFIYKEPPAADGKIKVRFGFPISGNPKNSFGFKLVNDKGMKCVWRQYQGSTEGVVDAIAQLYLDAQLKGYQFTGESRQLAGNDNTANSKTISLELQLGVK